MMAPAIKKGLFMLSNEIKILPHINTNRQTAWSFLEHQSLRLKSQKWTDVK